MLQYLSHIMTLVSEWVLKI